VINSLFEIGKFIIAIGAMIAAAVIAGMIIDAFLPFDKNK